MEVMVTKDAMFWKGKRVLVTGHTGFKGSWLLLWLQQLGADVWGYALEPNHDQSNLFRGLIQDNTIVNQWHHCIGNVNDFTELKKWVQQSQPDVVFHLAAQPLVRSSYLDPLGTWSTNVNGSLHLLEALKLLKKPCAVIMVTTDKVYENREWGYGYREPDRLGGHDPYSASKAAAEIAISSWRSSFCGDLPHQTSFLRIATARSGNVIGGGDWALDRIVPDAMRALRQGNPIVVRNPHATRPWQHVLEPLSGYLRLAESLLSEHKPPCEAFNFGPQIQSNRSVKHLVERILKCWPGSWVDQSKSTDFHEASLLHLQIDKAFHCLHWKPRWGFLETVDRTVNWYKNVYDGSNPIECCLIDLEAYQSFMPCGD